MNGAAAPKTDVTIVEWAPDDGSEPPVDLGALLTAYHLATEAEKAERGLAPAARTVDDLPERYRAEVAAPRVALAGRSVLLAVSGGVAIGCAILTSSGSPDDADRSGIDSPDGASASPSASASSSAEAGGSGSGSGSGTGTGTGTLLALGLPARLGTGPSVDLSRLWIDAAERRTGAGGALVRHAVALAGERGAASVRLSVWSWRADAIALYHRNGFTRVPSRDRRPELVCFERRVSDAAPGHPG